MKRGILPILLLFLLPLAVSQNFEPTSVYIKAVLRETGTINVEEYYSFPKTLEASLISLSESLGSRYSLWKSYINGLDAHVCGNPVSPRIVLKTEVIPKLILSYSCNTVKNIGEDLLYITYEVSSFRFPISSGLMTLPEGYTLDVTVNMGKIVNAEPEPTIRETNHIVWEGPLSSAQRFYIRYQVPKVYTVPSVSQRVLRLLEDPRLGITVLALLIILYAGREKLKKLIVHWVSSTTEITKE